MYDLFPTNVTGIVTGNDKVAIAPIRSELTYRMDTVRAAADEKEILGLWGKFSRGQTAEKIRYDVLSDGIVTPIAFRPFDTRWTYYSGNSCGWVLWPREKATMGHLLSQPTSPIGANIVLVGEGQEIYTDENSGIAQWNTAIDHATEKSWAILCPDKLISTFPDKPLFNIANRNSLNLSMSLRTHLAGDVSQFANALVAGKIDEAKSFARNVKAQGFRMYVTRDLSHAKRFLRQRYDGEQDKRYGMIASSKGKLLRHYGMDNSFQGALSQRAYHLSSCSLI